MLLGSKLGLQAGQQLGVDTGIDFALENLLGAFDGQTGHLVAQGFTGLDDLLVGFGLGSGDDLGGFVVGSGFGLFNEGLGAAGVLKP